MEEQPKVYYRSARSSSLQTSLVSSVLTLFDVAGFDKMIKPHDVVAIKLHCGEWNNTAYLRPVYARAVADRVKELGGRPFVCDTVTLPYGPFASRATSLDLLITAERNGYNSATLGCPFIVADGSSGMDDVRVELPEGYILKEAFVAHAVASADVLIVLTHFKGHATGMIGGAIKNLGIGAQSQRGKRNVHMARHPNYGIQATTDFHPERCLGRKGCPVWETCANGCPQGAIEVTEDSVIWHRDRCNMSATHYGTSTWCGVFDFPKALWEASNVAMADACLATVKTVGRDKVGFINLAIDIAPGCDCADHSDIPVVPNLGVLASTDPVALDAACLDLITASPGMPGSAAEDLGVMEPGRKKMETVSGTLQVVNEDLQINTGVAIGLGRRDYQLIEVEAPADAEPFRFAPDKRPFGLRMRDRTPQEKDNFPWGRFGDKGYDRLDEVDFEPLRGARAAEMAQAE